jgi:hypothetical protein
VANTLFGSSIGTSNAISMGDLTKRTENTRDATLDCFQPSSRTSKSGCKERAIGVYSPRKEENP